MKFFEKKTDMCRPVIPPSETSKILKKPTRPEEECVCGCRELIHPANSYEICDNCLTDYNGLKRARSEYNKIDLDRYIKILANETDTIVLKIEFLELIGQVELIKKLQKRPRII